VVVRDYLSIIRFSRAISLLTQKRFAKMPNKVISSSTIKTISNGGRQITLQYATKTDTWNRYNLATDVQQKFAKAMEKADVPAGATTAIMA
jgi:hypothetical protein